MLSHVYVIKENKREEGFFMKRLKKLLAAGFILAYSTVQPLQGGTCYCEVRAYKKDSRGYVEVGAANSEAECKKNCINYSYREPRYRNRVRSYVYYQSEGLAPRAGDLFPRTDADRALERFQDYAEAHPELDL